MSERQTWVNTAAADVWLSGSIPDIGGQLAWLTRVQNNSNCFITLWNTCMKGTNQLINTTFSFLAAQWKCPSFSISRYLKVQLVRYRLSYIGQPITRVRLRLYTEVSLLDRKNMSTLSWNSGINAHAVEYVPPVKKNTNVFHLPIETPYFTAHG